MYVRVKRRKQTFFLHVEPTDTILELKSKLQDLVQQPPERQQLLKETTVLEDAKKLADLKVENDDVLAVTFMQEGELARGHGNGRHACMHAHVHACLPTYAQHGHLEGPHKDFLSCKPFHSPCVVSWLFLD